MADAPFHLGGAVPPASANPATKEAMPKNWSNLPAEIKAKILGHLEKKADLKACRLVDSKTSAEATRWLFHTLCLWPSTRSLNLLVDIAERPQFANCVKALECHPRGLAALDFASCIKVGFLAEKLRVLTPIEASLQTYRLFTAYKEELRSQEGFQAHALTLLSTILSCFPNIKVFTHRSKRTRTGDDYLLPEDSVLCQRTGVRALSGNWLSKGLPVSLSVKGYWNSWQECPAEHRDFALKRRVEALPSRNAQLSPCVLQPTVVELHSHDWRDFMRLMAPPRQGVELFLSNVRHFKLVFEVQSFNGREVLNPSSRHWKDGLNSALSRLGHTLLSARELWFGFDEELLMTSNLLSNARTITRMSRLLLTSTYENLTDVTLQNFSIDPRSLCDFVFRYSKTLKSLTIQNLHLVNPDKDLASLVDEVLKLVVFIHDHARLVHFSIEGVVENITTIGLVCRKIGGDSLLRDVCEYVCHRGEFPFIGLRKFWDQFTDGDDVYVDGWSYIVKGNRNMTAVVTLESDDSWKYGESTAKRLSDEDVEQLMQGMREEFKDDELSAISGQ
ncbi:hypothetical protein H2200_000939 [Cladophialophora chaetospira]|uniref:F-box domain-containing protein n=1 Tax=Cladophialophora chaetospira TaxID=386627 RepID=A0AA38XPC7_9EURO|nr:hypothetical protein H2200_000939 [Cladophialophora chaetospira]